MKQNKYKYTLTLSMPEATSSLDLQNVLIRAYGTIRAIMTQKIRNNSASKISDFLFDTIALRTRLFASASGTAGILLFRADGGTSAVDFI